MSCSDQLRSQLEELAGSNVLILCMGNELKGDDGAGPALYQLLKSKTPLPLIDAGTVPENYIQQVIAKAPEHLIIVDAIDFGALPGSAKLFSDEQVKGAGISTHAPSPAVFLSAIKSQIDVKVQFLAIQPRQVELGAGLSEEVGKAVKELAGLLAEMFGKCD